MKPSKEPVIYSIIIYSEDTLVQTREHEDELLEKITQKGKRWKASLIIIIQSQSS